MKFANIRVLLRAARDMNLSEEKDGNVPAGLFCPFNSGGEDTREITRKKSASMKKP